MASTNKTALGLTQYALDDIPDMTDTNNDNAILTAELQKRPEADTNGKYPKAVNADTAGTADNAKNAAEGGPLDARLEAIEADIQQQQEDLAEFPTSGTAAVAKKLETAREIRLIGDVSGSTTFDGSKNVSISAESLRGINGATETENINPKPWYKIASVDITDNHYDAVLYLLVWYGYGLKGRDSNDYGILYAHLRTSNNHTTENCWLEWILCGNRINPDNFYICHKVEGTTVKVELWSKNEEAYTYLHTLVLDHGNRSSTINPWTIHSLTTGVGQPQLPANYTHVKSTLGVLKGLISNGIMLPFNSGENSFPIELESVDNTKVRLISAKRTRDDVIMPIFMIQGSPDGAAWTTYGRITPKNYIDLPEDLITLEYANSNFESMSRNGAIYKVWKNWNNVAAVNGYYKLASTNLAIDDVTGHESIEIEGNIGGFTSSGYFKLSVNERGSAVSSITFEGYGFKAINTADLLVIKNAENKREIYFKTTTTDVKWIKVNLKITKLADSHAHWTVHLNSHSQVLPNLTSGSPSGTVEFSLKSSWPEQKIRTQITENEANERYLPKTGGAGAHNSIYRGNNLGTSVTAAQYAAINAGTFDNLYIGDYWVIGGVTYRIAAFDYYLRCGNTDLTTHHVVIVPDSNLYNLVMNDSNTTAGGYVGSKMYTTGLTQAKTTIKAAFNGHVLKHRVYLTNAVSNGRPSAGAWCDSEVELMNERMVYGCPVFIPMENGSSDPGATMHNYTVEKSQLALFAHRPDLISNRLTFWLRDVVTATHFARVYNYGLTHYASAGTSLGVRPAFCIS